MAKKTFKKDINPAMEFISQESVKAAETAPQAPQTPPELPEVYPVRFARSESKSRRVQLLIKPSVYNGLKTMAAERGTSFNGLVNIVLEDYIS